MILDVEDVLQRFQVLMRSTLRMKPSRLYVTACILHCVACNNTLPHDLNLASGC